MLAIIGITFQFMAVYFYKLPFKIFHKKLIIYNYFYDILVLLGALFSFFYLHNKFSVYIPNGIYTFFLLLIGIFFPIFFWLFQKNYIILRKSKLLNICFTITSAISEEIIWRGALILFLQNLNLSFYTSLLISSIGFFIIHLHLIKLKSSLYLLIFTIVLMFIFSFLGIIASILFHVSHNLALQIFRPVKRGKKKGPVSIKW
ncbi:membrane protease YdiL (CAAX protease family) [Staphylococcus hominis]